MRDILGTGFRTEMVEDALAELVRLMYLWLVADRIRMFWARDSDARDNSMWKYDRDKRK
jgi:hypothetical protein